MSSTTLHVELLTPDETGWSVRRAGGLILNQRLNVARDEYDALKAILFNCTRGDAPQQDRLGLPNFQAHLAGRVAYVASIHPERGRRLRALFERIVWPKEASG